MRTGRGIRAVRLPGSGFVTGCCCIFVLDWRGFPELFRSDWDGPSQFSII